MHVEASHGEFAAARGDGVVAGAELDQIATGGQARQRVLLQVAAFFAARAELADELV